MAVNFRETKVGVRHSVYATVVHRAPSLYRGRGANGR